MNRSFETAPEPLNGLRLRLRLLKMAAPLFVAQIALMMQGIIDTLMAGRLSAEDVAGIGLGASIYFSVYIGLMGVQLGLVPICARHYGAGDTQAIGLEVRQGYWLALVLAVPGCVVLGFTDLWLAVASPPDEVAAVTRPYLAAAAVGLPAALLFRNFHALAVATSRPGLVMGLNLAMLVLKIPANLLFMHGFSVGAWLTVPAMGGAGCGVATALLAWITVVAAALMLGFEPGLRRYRALVPARPSVTWLRRVLKLGLPIGATQLVEVTSFTFMAIFLARQEAVVGASHQIAARLAGLTYMIGLALGTATSTLAAQALGAGSPPRARDIALTGLRLGAWAGLFAMALLFGFREPLAALFSTDPAVVAMAIPLVVVVCVFHFFDSAQTQITLVLRAWHVTGAPMFVHLAALWGVGLGGGWWLTYAYPATGGPGSQWLSGAAGFWVAGAVALALATAGVGWLLWRVWRDSTDTTARHPNH